jgi:NAD(P)-dependent dehydrogenase (short-subunit alcohol dehydrogenase family)
MQPLAGKVAVVTGASRGAGRAIAAVLGERGATVYVTGRSVRGGKTVDDMPGTIEETADEVDRRGGRGIAVRCDHTVDAEVERLFAQVRREAGRLDLLVNNAWGGYEGGDGGGFEDPFWEQPALLWEGMFQAGVRASLLASRAAAPILIAQKSGLIVHITAWDRERYLGNLFYDVAKSAISRMARGMARELMPHGVAALAVAPGFMRTERVLAAVADDPSFDPSCTESPEYVGRAVAALAADPVVLRWSGLTVPAGKLAVDYGFTDVDGRVIPPFELPDKYLLD